MKEKITAELKTKFKDLGFADKAFDGVAEYLSKTVTEEKDIETAISGVEPLLKAFQAESDRRATELQKTTKELQEEIKTLKEKKDDPPNPKKKDDNPDYDGQIKALQEKLEGFEKFDKQREARAELKERAKEKKIPAVLLKNVNVDSIDEIDSIVSNLEKEALALRQEIINESTSKDRPVVGSGGAGNKEQIADDIRSHPIKKK